MVYARSSRYSEPSVTGAGVRAAGYPPAAHYPQSGYDELDSTLLAGRGPDPYGPGMLPPGHGEKALRLGREPATRRRELETPNAALGDEQGTKLYIGFAL